MQQTTHKSERKESPSATGIPNAALPPPAKQATLPPTDVVRNGSIEKAFAIDPLRTFLAIGEGKYGDRFHELRENLSGEKDPVMSIAKRIYETPGFDKTQTDRIISEAELFFERKQIPDSWSAKTHSQQFNTTVTVDPKNWSLKEIDTFRENKYEIQTHTTRSDIPLENGLRKGEVTFSPAAGGTLETFWRIDTNHRPPISLVISSPDGTHLHTHVLKEVSEKFARLTISPCKEGKYLVEAYPYDVTAPGNGINKNPDIVIPIRTEFLLLRKKD